ncbi:DoxX family protein [uncultured Rikenella sp.]|uniref:DoxX family protein n=1 Tax=uncultured Rikenella sp. TaxID=368003 RepID=UPI0026130F6F|nr:DoxX family protein [uncultured Rikenella sp.]
MNTNSNPWVRFLLSERYANLALLFLRLFVGGMMLTHGIAKIQNFAALREGFPDPIGWGVGLSLVMIILVEIGGSLMVIAGLLTRFAVIPLVFAMIMAMTVHPDTSLGSIELPLLYLGMYVVIFIAGPGKCSIDCLIGKTIGRSED